MSTNDHQVNTNVTDYTVQKLRNKIMPCIWYKGNEGLTRKGKEKGKEAQFITHRT